MHVVFYACIAAEGGAFDIADVLEGICAKLRHRHPHVYGEATAADEQEVCREWERLKLQEAGRERVLAGVPASLPSLVKAWRVQAKARGVGFDWPRPADVWDKVREELRELEVELGDGPSERVEEEFGDFLFSLVNVARLHEVNPDTALEKATRKFTRRFNYIEEQARLQGRPLPGLSMEEMEALWQEANEQERGRGAC
jgi:XTP/dITP diphosphohydrolase